MLYELDVLPGLKDLALEEWSERMGEGGRLLPDEDPEAVRFEWQGAARSLLALRLPAAAHRVLHFQIRRPSQLLGDQDFRRLTAALVEVGSSGGFTALRLNAAGSDSRVFTRLKTALAEAVGLAVDDGDGDLLLRVRPSQLRSAGWDVLIRLTPRPLATRSWRLANMPGALNANVAAAMVRLTGPRSSDRVMNLMCGSGSLLAERAAVGPARMLVGCDIRPAALRMARANAPGVELLSADAAHLPFADSSVDVILADLPWGNLSGSHAENLGLYPRALAEAARVGSPGVRFAAITHEVRLIERSLAAQAHWRVRRELTVLQGGAHPRIHLLEPAGTT